MRGMVAGWIMCGLMLVQTAPGPAGAQPGQAQEVIRLVNAFRAAHGLPREPGHNPVQFVPGNAGMPSLATNPALMAAAQGHADWQAATHNHYHQGKDGSTPQDRANAAGYRGWVSENVASGTTSAVSPEWAVNVGWANSPPHRANMLSRNVDVGAGVAQDADQTYYVLLVGSPAIQTGPTAVPRSAVGPPPAGAIVHTVEEGETPWSIAVWYGVPLDTLLAVNRLNPNEILQPGEPIIIPPADFQATPAASGAAPTPGSAASSDHAPGGIPPILLIGVALAASILALTISVMARRRRPAGTHKP